MSEQLLFHDAENDREFLVAAELYVSNAAAGGLRKPAPSRKKTDKRESSAGLSGDADLKGDFSVLPAGAADMFEEKSSWVNLTRSLSGAGQWRSATCKLMEEGSRCLLNVYVDESILFQTAYIHLLNQTDIRLIDSSMFFRKDCIGIYCISGQRWASPHVAEPIYLHFANSELRSTWLALLKSYAVPETYGRWYFPANGGSYRMWRQIELGVSQGRSFGNTWSLEPGSGLGNGDELNGDVSATEAQISCEIHVGDILCGRTTVKKGVESLDWHERFTFSDLPPFEFLDINVWREKKLSKPRIIGTTRIQLGNFRRGEATEGWFPVMQNGVHADSLQLGELRLKIKVDEEIILPYAEYAQLLKTFFSRNFMDWMSDFESKLKLKNMSMQLMTIALTNNTLIEQVQEFAAREMSDVTISRQTLFRGNTILTAVMEQSMSLYGKAFLEASIGSVLRRLCAEKVAIEVDPLRGKNTKDVEKSVDQLIYWCNEFWIQIYSVRSECPVELRKLFETIRKLVEERYECNDGSPNESKRDLPRQSVSAFCFLRFIVPAILHPHLFGLCPGLPSGPVKRSLTLIAKVIQSLANLNVSVQKESFMRGVKDFLSSNLPAMIDYITIVSTPTSSQPSQTGDTWERHDRLNIALSLRQRTRGMPILDSEAIPMPPHLVDIPRNLAILVSAVIRHTRDFNTSTPSREPYAGALGELCSRCLDVEAAALSKVRSLAAKMAAAQEPYASTYIPSPSSPAHTRNSSLHLRSSPSNSNPRRSDRPWTAPSTSNQLTPIRRAVAHEDTSAASRTVVHNDSEGKDPTSQRRRGHVKSPSTDIAPSSFANDSHSAPRVDTFADVSDDLGKRRRGILKNLLRR